MITQKYLKKILNYKPDTGIFTWKIQKAQSIKIGQIAGCKHKLGYIHIEINRKKYKAHRLAWLYHYGKWPENEIDHVYGIRDDNRIKNLREATNSQNQANKGKYKNNNSGQKGVCWHKRDKKWRAQINFNNKKIYLGSFSDKEDAKNAYDVAAKEYFGEYARTN